MKKAIIVGVLLSILLVSLTGCTDSNWETTRTIRNVYIVDIKEINGDYSTQPYNVIFSNGMKVGWVIDKNIFLIEKDRELEYITFITSLQYSDGLDIGDYKYCNIECEE